MKRWKTYAGLLLALVLCLSLAACGGGNSDNDDDIIDGVEDTAPDTIENLVIDTSVEFDYSAYMGTWLGEDDSVLVMEHVDGITNSERFRAEWRRSGATCQRQHSVCGGIRLCVPL